MNALKRDDSGGCDSAVREALKAAAAAIDRAEYENFLIRGESPGRGDQLLRDQGIHFGMAYAARIVRKMAEDA
jgi:lysophospholipase L1-like esterase